MTPRGAPYVTVRCKPDLKAAAQAVLTPDETLTAVVIQALEVRVAAADVYPAAQARAAARGETLTDVILRALRAYVEEET